MSIHQQALANLRRGAKPVLVFLAALFALMTVYVVGGLLLTQRNMPVAPTDSATAADPGATTGTDPPATAGAAADTWRGAVVAFLTDAVKKDPARWFPGATAETDGLTYTPLSPDDPAGDRPDGLARVPYRDLSADAQRTALAAVSRDGKVDPASLSVTAAGGTDARWELAFTVKVRGAAGAPLAGEAEGYTTASGATVVLRLVYPRAGDGG